MVIQECTIGDSVCIDTLYELTQRELEAGRMSPTHSLINIAVDASAKPHYSHKQLLRQESKIKEVNDKSVLKRISNIFKK